MTATLTAPNRSTDQRMEALRNANRVRTSRSRLKRELKAGRVQVAQLILDPPEYLLTATAHDLLLAVPKYGRVRVNKLLVSNEISLSKSIGGLTARQRGVLVAALGGRL